MASQGWRCHNDFPIAVTILDCTAVQKKEDDPKSIVRFYNCEVAWGDSKWRVSRRYNMFHQLHEDLRMEFSTAHCLPPLPPKSQPAEQLSRFIMSDEDDVDVSEEQFLRARERGLQAYINQLIAIPCVSWSKRFANFLEPDSGLLAVASEGSMTGVYGLQRSQFGLAVALLQQHYMETPLWRHVFPDPTERRAGLEHFMMCYVEAGYYHGYAYVLGTEEHELAAIGLWLPPNTDITVMKMFKFGFGKLPLDIGMDASVKWQKIYSAWDEHRAAIMGDQAHWYLWASAVQPSLDDRVGHSHCAIVKVVTDLADSHLPRCPCYTEVTTAVEMTALKEVHGFAVMEYHEATADTLAYHLLRRDTPETATPSATSASNGINLVGEPVVEPSYEGSWV